MLFQPALLRDVQFDLSTVTDLCDLPPLWALHDLFPCHRLSLVAAPTGSGLTQLACHLASAIATQPGTPTGQVIHPGPNPDGSLPDPIIIPNESGPKTCPSVLLISRRDHADVLKPRLQALGIDTDQVLILSSIHRDLPKVLGQPPRHRIAPFSIEDDLDALYELLHEYTTIRLVLIDNADLLFAATNDPARAKVQRDLDALANVAESREVAIVLLAGVPNLQRNPFASRLFAAMRDACRLVYFMAPDLDDPQQRLLFCIKNTLSRYTSTRRLQTLLPASPGSFRALNTDLQSLTFPHYFFLLHQQQRSFGRPPDLRDDACQFLLQALCSGPLPVGSRRNPAPGTLRYMADEAGCAWGTISRAKEVLHITSHFQPEHKHWTWHLPDTIPQLLVSKIQNPESRIQNSSSSFGDQLCPPAPPIVAQSSPTAVPGPVPGSRADGAKSPEPPATSMAPATTPADFCVPAPSTPAQVPPSSELTSTHPTPTDFCAPAPVACSPAPSTNTPARHEAVDPPADPGVGHPAQTSSSSTKHQVPSTTPAPEAMTPSQSNSSSRLPSRLRDFAVAVSSPQEPSGVAT